MVFWTLATATSFSGFTVLGRFRNCFWQVLVWGRILFDTTEPSHSSTCILWCCEGNQLDTTRCQGWCRTEKSQKTFFWVWLTISQITTVTGKIRIFLDLVGFIGDTPAINSVLDVLGYTSSSCCHLCKMMRRSNSIVGSRYARRDYHAFSSSVCRGMYQHTAVRDCGANPENLRLLGISAKVRQNHLPIHDLQVRMMQIRNQIPTTKGGTPIISGFLDPYRACLIAPDHLLTGHFRDCVNVAFRLLPTAKHRQSCEQFMVGLLKGCNLSTQNRLYDHEKRACTLCLCLRYTLFP